MKRNTLAFLLIFFTAMFFGHSAFAADTKSYTVKINGKDIVPYEEQGKLIVNGQSYDFVVTPIMGLPQYSPIGVQVNSTSSVNFMIAITSPSIQPPSSVRLMRASADGTSFNEIEQLYDDGNIDHGDAIAGDGVYCTIHIFSEPISGDVNLKIAALVNESAGTVEHYSAPFVVKVIQDITDETFSAIKATQDSGVNQYEDYRAGRTEIEAKKLTVAWLNQQPNVMRAQLTISGDISIDYTAGLSAMICFIHEGQLGGTSEVDQKINSVSSFVPSNQNRRELFPKSVQKPANNSSSSYYFTDYELNHIINRNVFLWSPFYHTLISNKNDLQNNDKLALLLDNSLNPLFDKPLKHLKDGECTVNSLKNITNYGVICLLTHGGVDEYGEQYFITREPFLDRHDHYSDWITGSVKPIWVHSDDLNIVTSEELYGVWPKFIDRLPGKFPGSIIFAEFCYSTTPVPLRYPIDSPPFWEAFKAKGANTYFGFSSSVTYGTANILCDDLFKKLVTEHRSTGQSFLKDFGLDPVGLKAYYEMFGNPYAYFEPFIEMVSIPAGSFQMGGQDTSGIYIWDGCLPVHTVSLSAFEMSKYEITQCQYKAVIGSNPSYFTGDDNLPVEQVSWWDAIKFCNALSMQNGLQPCYDESTGYYDFNKNGYRLPSEAEWEYACRAGSTTKYNLGDATSDLDRAGWYFSNSGSQTHPVGQKTPNTWMLYDMHGNVFEWCNDWYGSYTSDTQNNPTGEQFGFYREYRGGSFGHYEFDSQSWFRSCNLPDISYLFIGFRVVRRP